MELIDIIPEFNLYEEFWKIYTKSDIIPPQYISADAVVERLSLIHIFTENAVAISNDEALADFTLGKAAMFYNGSWSCGFINGRCV